MDLKGGRMADEIVAEPESPNRRADAVPAQASRHLCPHFMLSSPEYVACPVAVTLLTASHAQDVDGVNLFQPYFLTRVLMTRTWASAFRTCAPS